jgi:hypothetical protein
MKDAGREPWRDNYRNALTALPIVREMIETLGPPGDPAGSAWGPHDFRAHAPRRG